MKPNETLLLLFHFICGSFLEQKATEYEWLLIEIMLDLPALTFLFTTCLQDGVEISRVKTRVFKNWTLALPRTLDFGDHE